MTANYVLLERIELAASAASVTFASLPQSGYTDLKVVASGRCTTSNSNATISFNGSSASFSSRILEADGSSAYSASRSDNLNLFFIDASDQTANTFGSSEIYIPNYLSSSYKSFSVEATTENNATGSYMRMVAGLWSATPAAINSITLAPQGSAFAANSTFSIYGLAAVGTTPAIAPKATGGNIQTDGTYWYHTFLASGTFTPATNLTCEVLAIAGGAAGGGTAGNGGGGGGAGGVVYQLGRSVTTTAVSVQVGAGGTGASNASGTNGVNTLFDTITAIGGGYGGASSIPGNSGGSGGGSGGGPVNSGGTATQGSSGGGTGYGFNGGDGSGNGAGGGGGAGAVGQFGGQVVPGTGGNGGAGLNTWSTWASVTGTGVSGFYAGGGAGGYSTGGTGGSGGGGNGGSYSGTTTGVAGTAFTGSGGGGSSAAGAVAGANGGSGIVIIRYPIA